jgi:hypothetical protein
MRPIRFVLLLAIGGAFASSAYADSCSDLSMRFAGGERFAMKLGELDELKTCINTLLREKISASSTEARGSTSPAVSGSDVPPPQAPRPIKTTSVLQDAE